ncbi:CPBP family intramembrane metalloprotease [Elizabethkingia anophelis]|uniref:CPBP family glutamic-type intramembrane protease n=1 Tax=Elizabethkingia anophelis TaxID=1117645 RepID=UPI00099B13B7|nr:CPBP family glutamic-type intramembrane protease [Elizabethkingia anophelis]MCT4013728.1 CPBP family intramembrane metalloprotease [Elizabethkingia anophelis]MDV3899507.1 CPBP family intramembrane metalloprotease [Elizabethkingia anophelis]OPC53934.1 hypothetical protein BAY06_13750 [Elizabethkingia anophelis]
MKIEQKAYVKVVYFSIFSILYSFITMKFTDYLGINENDIGGAKFKSPTQEVVITILIGPLLETFLYQYLVYKIVYFIKSFIQRSILKKEVQYLIFYLVISSVLFAISHSYSRYYVFLMLIPGAILAFAFYYFKRKYSYPFFYVLLIHFLHNLFILIYEKL